MVLFIQDRNLEDTERSCDSVSNETDLEQGS